MIKAEAIQTGNCLLFLNDQKTPNLPQLYCACKQEHRTLISCSKVPMRLYMERKIKEDGLGHRFEAVNISRLPNKKVFLFILSSSDFQSLREFLKTVEIATKLHRRSGENLLKIGRN